MLLSWYQSEGSYFKAGAGIPFWWRDHFDYASFHSVFIDSGDEFFKVGKLIHRLHRSQLMRKGGSEGITGLKTGMFPSS